ncbi:MAG: hypothetical protein ACR2PW_04560 [Gammaproteobacteria bacterium]
MVEINEDGSKKERGGVRVYIPPAFIATLIAGGIVGGERYLDSRSPDVVPADVLAEVRKLRDEERIRINKLQRDIDSLNARFRWHLDSHSFRSRSSVTPEEAP